MLEATFAPRKRERKRRKMCEMAERSPWRGWLPPAGGFDPPGAGAEVADGPDELPGGGWAVEARGAEVSSQEHWLDHHHCHALLRLCHCPQVTRVHIHQNCETQPPASIG